MSVQVSTQQGPAIVPAGTWHADPAHTTVEFSVKHMMIATVKGRFAEFEGALEVGDTPEDARAYGTITAASIDTKAPQRDEHLRSGDFFDAERFPELRFESTRIEHVDGPVFRIVGELTIRDVTREIELEATVQGAGRDPWGNERVAVEARGELDRKEFGLDWNQALEAGGVLVGNTVKLAVDLSVVKAAEAQAA